MAINLHDLTPNFEFLFDAKTEYVRERQVVFELPAARAFR